MGVAEQLRPPGNYPGDRSYIGWFVAGALLALVAILQVLPGGITLVAFGIAAVAALSAGAVGFTNARTKRFELWNRLATDLAPPDHSRILDIASLDLLAGASLVRANPHVVLAAAPDPGDASLVEANLAAVRAAYPGDLPPEDASFDVIVSDSSRALMKRAKVDAVLAEIVRLAAPGAQVAIVTSAQTKRIRAGLETAGVTDISIDNVLGTFFTGYHLVRARFPDNA